MLLLIIGYASNSNAVDRLSIQIAKAAELKLSNPDKSRIILENIDETQLSTKERELYKYLTAYNLFINGNVQNAINSLNELISTSVNINIKVKALGLLLSLYATSNEWLKALQIADRLENHLDPSLNVQKSQLDVIQHYILNFYNNIGEYDSAMRIAKELLSTNISPRLRCTTSTELLNSQVKTSIDDISTLDFEKASKICKKVNEPTVLQAINAYYAEYHLALNSPQKAIELLESNMPNVTATQFQALIATFHSLLAESHLALKNYDKAEKYAQILNDTIEQHHYQPSITTSYKVLAAVKEHQQHYKQAFYHYKKYSEANQIQINQNNAKLLAIKKAKLDVVEKNTQIALLDKENALLKTQMLLDEESAQSRRLAIGLLSMALIVFILWAYKNRKIYLKMRHFAETDELTGISNRHHFAQLALSAIKLCQRTDQPVSFIIFDLDHFKKINDSYGHLAGDEALKMAVNAAKSCCRRNDVIGRLGGEEFGILLPGCGNHLASHIAEKCRKAIEKIDSEVSGHKFVLTASFGVADSSVCGYEFTKLFAGADRALYQSKDLGRNQVFNYQTNLFAYDI